MTGRRIHDKILGIDQGSSHTRAVLFTDKGERLCEGSAPLRTYYPRPGAVEHDPKEILKSAYTVIQAVLKKHGGNIAAIGIANQRSTLLCWDGKTGEPLSPAISWQARHDFLLGEADFTRKWDAPFLQEKTGLPLTRHYAATKLSGLLNRIGRNRKNLMAGTVNTFLIWHLTQGKSYFTDPTNAQRTLLYHITRHEWDDDLLHHFNIPKKILPDILPNQAAFGDAIINGVRIPITAAIGDQQSAFIGLGGFLKGKGAVNYGTGGFLLIHTGQKPVFLPGLLVSIAQSDQQKTSYLIEGTVNNVGGLFTWLKQVGLLNSDAEIDRAFSRSKEPVFFLPALTGLGTPYLQSNVRGALLGLAASTQREDIIRGAVSGIAYLMHDIYQVIPAAIQKQIHTITATGGGTHITSLIQFQADLFGKTISIATDLEATVRGAAFLAGKERGLTDETQFCFAPIQKIIRPNMRPKERTNLLAKWHAVINQATIPFPDVSTNLCHERHVVPNEIKKSKR